MNLAAFSPDFLEAVRKLVEHRLNVTQEWRAATDKRYRSPRLVDVPNEVQVSVKSVLDFEDETYYSVYCETCSYEETRCRVTYELQDGTVGHFDYADSFSNLIDDLTHG